MKFVRLLVILTLCGVLATAIMFLQDQPNKTTPSPTPPAVGAVKIVQPINLAGEWQSVESRAGTKFVGHIKNNTIQIEMSATDGFATLWYGTFDVLQPGEKVMVSKAIDDPQYFALSSAETKDFLYQDISLVFDFAVMGTRTTIEMKRV
jgi:hypothetical protein